MTANQSIGVQQLNCTCARAARGFQLKPSRVSLAGDMSDEFARTLQSTVIGCLSDYMGEINLVIHMYMLDMVT